MIDDDYIITKCGPDDQDDVDSLVNNNNFVFIYFEKNKYIKINDIFVNQFDEWFLKEKSIKKLIIRFIKDINLYKDAYKGLNNIDDYVMCNCDEWCSAEPKAILNYFKVKEIIPKEKYIEYYKKYSVLI